MIDESKTDILKYNFITLLLLFKHDNFFSSYKKIFVCHNYNTHEYQDRKWLIYANFYSISDLLGHTTFQSFSLTVFLISDVKIILSAKHKSTALINKALSSWQRERCKQTKNQPLKNMIWKMTLGYLCYAKNDYMICPTKKEIQGLLGTLKNKANVFLGFQGFEKAVMTFNEFKDLWER